VLPLQYPTADRESENVAQWLTARTFATETKFDTFNTLLSEQCAGEKYFQYLRMDVAIFEELYALAEPEIIRKLAT